LLPDTQSGASVCLVNKEVVMIPDTQKNSKQALEDAFQTFNQLSDQLAASYHALEQQVSHLNEELTRSHDARLKELTEKERLANRLYTLLQALPGGVIVLDSDGRIQEFNPAAEDLLGTPLEGELWMDVINRAFSPRTDDGHEVSLTDGRRVNISTCPLLNEPGQIILITDVTEMRDLQDNLNQKQRLVEMGEMAASLAHQIRTPLASAMLYNSNLKRSGLSDSDQTRYIGKIKDRLAHLERIVNDMLLYARSNSIGLEEVFCMEQLFTELELHLDSLLLNTDIDYSWHDHTDGVEVNANKQMLISALSNLCVNAIQAMQGNGKIQVTARMSSDRNIEILVCDNGPGMNDDKAKNIFDPFFTTRNEGTGLGLAVVRAIVNAHKGQVIVDSQLGVGTTFIVRIPLIDAVNNNFVESQARTVRMVGIS
jgi:two-component system sensor histidine kinase FlrB